MRKYLILIISFCLMLVLLLALFVACNSKKQELTEDLSLLRYYTLDIGNFSSLALKPIIQDEAPKSCEASTASEDEFDNIGMLLCYKQDDDDDYEEAQFVSSKGTNDTVINDNKSSEVSTLTQNNAGTIVDKLYVMYDYTLISIVSDLSEYKRPNNSFKEYNPLMTYNDGEYDCVEYISNDKRASFVIDNRTGQMYYIEIGTIVSVDNWGFIKDAALKFDSDNKVKTIALDYKCTDYQRIVRDIYGQSYVPSIIDYTDVENGIKYYDLSGNSEYIRSNDGDVIHIEYTTNLKSSGRAGENNEIESIAIMNYGFGETLLTEGYNKSTDVDYYHKFRVGGNFINRIADGYVYISSGYGKIRLNRYAFIDGLESKYYYLDFDYYNNVDNDTSINNYAMVSYWDYDTVIITTDKIDGNRNYYYANMFEDNEYDGTDATLGKLHLIIEDATDSNLQNAGLAYMEEYTKENAIIIKNEKIYKLIEDDNSIIIAEEIEI